MQKHKVILDLTKVPARAQCLTCGWSQSIFDVSAQDDTRTLVRVSQFYNVVHRVDVLEALIYDNKEFTPRKDDADLQSR